MESNKIILRSVYKLTRMWMEPALDPETNRYPECVRKVNSSGDIIITEKDKESGKIFIAENEKTEIFDGKTFDLDDEYDKAWWEAIKNSRRIALERSYRDHKGDLVIDGDAKRYGTAEFYVEVPGKEAKQKASKKKLTFEAQKHIYNDTADKMYQRVRLLGHNMRGLTIDEVQIYLLEKAESDPQKIIDVYTGGDSHLRLLLLDALDKKVIVHRNKQIYQYGESIVLGATQDSVIDWMKNPQNNRFLDMIKADTYPSLYSNTTKSPEPVKEVVDLEDPDKEESDTPTPKRGRKVNS